MRRTVFVVAALVFVSGCSFERTWRASTADSNSLRIVRHGPEGRARTAADLPDILYELARDPAARRLIATLHPGLPVEVARVDSTSAALEKERTAPPSSPDRTAFRFADLGTVHRVYDGRETVTFFVWAAWVSVRSKAPDEPRVDPDSQEHMLSELASLPHAFEALALAIEDYLLRNDLGWAVCHWTVDRSQAPEDPAAHRAELDRKIADYARRFAAR